MDSHKTDTPWRVITCVANNYIIHGVTLEELEVISSVSEDSSIKSADFSVKFSKIIFGELGTLTLSLSCCSADAHLTKVYVAN